MGKKKICLDYSCRRWIYVNEDHYDRDRGIHLKEGDTIDEIKEECEQIPYDVLEMNRREQAGLILKHHRLKGKKYHSLPNQTIDEIQGEDLVKKKRQDAFILEEQALELRKEADKNENKSRN